MREELDNAHDAYENLDVTSIIKKMTFDEYYDWLNEDYVTKEDLMKAREVFEHDGNMEDHVRIIDIKLKDHEEENRTLR